MEKVKDKFWDFSISPDMISHVFDVLFLYDFTSFFFQNSQVSDCDGWGGQAASEAGGGTDQTGAEGSRGNNTSAT